MVVPSQVIGNDVTPWNTGASINSSDTNWDGLNLGATAEMDVLNAQAARAIDGFFEQLPLQTAEVGASQSSGARDNSAFDLYLDDYYAALTDHSSELELASANSSIVG